MNEPGSERITDVPYGEIVMSICGSGTPQEIGRLFGAGIITAETYLVFYELAIDSELPTG